MISSLFLLSRRDKAAPSLQQHQAHKPSSSITKLCGGRELLLNLSNTQTESGLSNHAVLECARSFFVIVGCCKVIGFDHPEKGSTQMFLLCKIRSWADGGRHA